MKLNVLKVILPIIVITVSGCSSTAGTQARLDADGKQEVTSYEFFSGLKIKQLKSNDINGMYQGKVIVENTRRSTQSLQYQFSWYNEGGEEIANDSYSWLPFTIYGKDQRTLSSLAPSPNATNFRVNIRDLKATKTFKTNFLGKI